LILGADCQPYIYKLVRNLRLLVDPVVLGGLPAVELVLLEPESNLLLGVLDGVGTVADVAADVNGEVATDGARGGGSGVGGTEKGTAGLDGITTLPDHGADGARVHVRDQTSEERLVAEVSVVLLEVLLAGGGELNGSHLEALRLEARDDGANQTPLHTVRLDSDESLLRRRHCCRCG